MERCSRWGEQERDRMGIFLGSHHFLLIMKHTPPPLVFPASAVLSICKTEKLSDGVTAVSGTIGASHVSVKQRMLQSLMSHWKLILALRSSILFSKDWTLAIRILGRGGLWAALRNSQSEQSSTLSRTTKQPIRAELNIEPHYETANQSRAQHWAALRNSQSEQSSTLSRTVKQEIRAELNIEPHYKTANQSRAQH